MRIHRLHLNNWGQHANLEVEFHTYGVTSLTGANNSGKSTLLSAIGWVLSPTSRNRYGDRHDIQDGQTTAAVTLEFTLEDNLHRPTKHILRKQITTSDDSSQKANPETSIELNGSILTGPEWEQFLKQHDEIEDPTQFLSLMISPQEEIHSLLRSAVGTRNKELRESLGIALPDSWHEFLKEETNQWSEKYAQRSGAIERALTDSETRLHERHQTQESLQLQLAELPQLETVAQQITEIEQWIHQLQDYQANHIRLQQTREDLRSSEALKNSIRAQTPSNFSPGDHSDLDLKQAKQQLRLLALAQCQQRTDSFHRLLQGTAAQAEPPWPLSIPEKQTLRDQLHAQIRALEKRILQQEIRQEQTEKLSAQINHQYTSFEAEAGPLETFHQAASYHTTPSERLYLRRIPLKDLPTQHQSALEKLNQELSKLEQERGDLTNRYLDPFTGTEAAATVAKIWNNRTPDDRCILTGAHLGHLNQQLVTGKAKAFLNIPLLSGNPHLQIPAHRAALARLAEINLQITKLEDQIAAQKTSHEPLIAVLETVPSQKWLKISIDAIANCLPPIKQNIECRRQIQNLQIPPGDQSRSLTQNTTLQDDKKEQTQLQRRKADLEEAIQLQTQFEDAQKELRKLNRAYNNGNNANSENNANTPGSLIAETPAARSLAETLKLSADEICESISTLEQIIQHEEQTREKTAFVERKIHLLKNNALQVESACASLKSALQTAQIDFLDASGAVDPIKANELQIQKINAAQTLSKIHQLQALKAQNQLELDKIIALRQQLQLEERETNGEKEDLQAAKEAADFLGPKRAPKQLLRAALQEIVHETNRILPQTGLEMELSVSPEMDFEVSFERGHTRITEPARRLGCGLATLVGMCLKMALARILQPNLKFLAFDEPSAQLDPLKKEAFAQFLKSLSQQALTGNQILVIEHDLGIAESCDHQIRLT